MQTRIWIVPLVTGIVASAFINAQAATSLRDGATIRGAVYDSTAHAPLANATVQLVSGDLVRSAITDSTGSYVLTDIPVGRYTLGFIHPVLDSIGIDAPLRELTVEGIEALDVNLAIPSPGRIRFAICGNPTGADSSAVIIGTVRDAGTGAHATGVSVKGEWIEYSLNRTGMSRRLRHLVATTGENGWYALCNVPASGTVVLTASRSAHSTASVEVQIPTDRYVRREIYLGTSATSGRITGKVTSVAARLPIADAQVMIADGPATRTNERGEFVLANAPQGTRVIEVRAVGYYPHRSQVNIISGAPPANIALSTLKAVLDTVKIFAKRLPAGPDDGGFAQRRKTSMGRFVTPADMARFPVINTSDVFRRIPRLRSDGVKIQMRGAFNTNQGQLGGENWCNVSIFVNGHNMSFMSMEDINDWVHPDEVAGIEVYSEGTVPPQFQPGLNGCGSVVIWTK